MAWHVAIADALLLTATLVAAGIDIRTRRIPNALTAALAFIAIGLHAAEGLTAFALAAAAMLVAFALGTAVFSLGWFGGGDVKLLAACCGLVSFPNCLALVGAVLATGAVLALAVAAREGRLIMLIRNTVAVATSAAPAQSGALPYAVAIAGGSAMYVAWTLAGPLRVGS